MDATFMEDYTDPNGKPYRRARMAFDMLKKDRKCTKGELKETLSAFRLNHPRTTWMPADFNTQFEIANPDRISPYRT